MYIDTLVYGVKLNPCVQTVDMILGMPNAANLLSIDKDTVVTSWPHLSRVVLGWLSELVTNFKAHFVINSDDIVGTQ